MPKKHLTTVLLTRLLKTVNKGNILVVGDSFTKSWDDYTFKSDVFNDAGSNSLDHLAGDGFIRSAKLFFDIAGFDASDRGIPGGSNSEAIDEILKNLHNQYDYIIAFLTTPSRDLEVKAYSEFKDFKIRTDDDIIWINKVSNTHTYSRLKEIANQHQIPILCVGGLHPIDTDIFSQFTDKYLKLAMPWCLKFLAPNLKENFKGHIRWGYLNDCGALDSASLDVMPPVYTNEVDCNRYGFRGARKIISGTEPDEFNWKSVEPWLFPDRVHLNLNAMWRIVDWLDEYITKSKRDQ